MSTAPTSVAASPSVTHNPSFVEKSETGRAKPVSEIDLRKPSFKEIRIVDNQPPNQDTRSEENGSTDEASKRKETTTSTDSEQGPFPWEAIPVLKAGTGRTGLLNLGNTCYLNSVLQALSHVPAFTYYFTVGWPQAAPPLVKVSNRERYVFVECFAVLLKTLWSGKYREFSASQVTKAIIAAVPEFEPGCQQDSQEALNYILNNLHDELFQAVPATQHPVRNTFLKVDAQQAALEDKIQHAKSKRVNASTTTTQSVSSDGNQISSKLGGKRRSSDAKSKLKVGSSMVSAPSSSSSTCSTTSNGTNNVATQTADAQGAKSSVDTCQHSDAPNNVKAGETHEERQALRQITQPYQQSIVNDSFLTYLTQMITCKRCGNSSISLEEYLELSVALPSKGQVKELRKQSLEDEIASEREEAGSRHSRSSSRGLGTVWGSLKSMLGMSGHSISLEDCFKAFFANEVLEGNEQYHCEVCNSKENAEKSYRIAHLPDVLCVHLKRFNKTSGWGLGNSKNSTLVNFPLEGLDLCPYEYRTTNGSPSSSTGHCDSDGCSLYDLVSVVKHTGGINSGHYISVCKNQADNVWYEFDDEFVNMVKPEHVCSADAYLLFYAKRHSATQLAKKKAVIEALSRSATDLHDWSYASFSEAKDSVTSSVPKPLYSDIVYVPVYWVIKWLGIPNPGAIYHSHLTCKHGKLKWPAFDDLDHRVVVVTRNFWKLLHESYGSQGPLEDLERCEPCFRIHSQLQQRRSHEHNEYTKRDRIKSSTVFLVHSRWLQQWRAFVLNENKYNGRGTWRGVLPPGEVTNGELLDDDGKPKPGLRKQAHYRSVNKSMWEFFTTTYGGGPALERVEPNIYEPPEVVSEVKERESLMTVEKALQNEGDEDIESAEELTQDEEEEEEVTIVAADSNT